MKVRAIKMTDIAVNLELLRVKEQQNATIAGLVEVLKAQGLTGLEDIESKVQSSPKSKSEKVLKDLRDQFTFYKSPLLGSEDFYELVHQHKSLVNQRRDQKDLDRFISAYEVEVEREPPRLITVTAPAPPAGAGAAAGEEAAPGPAPQPPFSYLHHPDLSATSRRPDIDFEVGDPGFRHQIQSFDKKVFPCYPDSGNRMKVPLKFLYPITLTDFTDKIKFYPLTTVLQLDLTIKGLLEKAEEIGYTKKNLNELFRQLVSQYFKEFYFTVENLSEPLEVFEALLCLINSEQVLINVKNQIKSFSREAGSTVNQTYMRYYSLTKTRLEVEEPTLGQEQIKAKTERLACYVIPGLVNSETKEKYKSWFSVRRSQGDQLSAADICDYLSKLEASSDVYKLTSTVYPPAKVDTEKVSLFLNDPSVEILAAEAELQKQKSHHQQQGRDARGRFQTKQSGRGGARGGGRGGGGGYSQPPFHGGQDNNRRPEGRGRSHSRPGDQRMARSLSRGRNNNQQQQNHHNSRRDSQVQNENSQVAPRHRSFSRERSHSRGRPQTPGPGGYQQGFQPRGRGFGGRGQRGFNRGFRGGFRGSFRGRGGRGSYQGGNRRQCERCLGNHETSNCFSYSVTTSGDCFNCGKGRHDQRYCRNAPFLGKSWPRRGH